MRRASMSSENHGSDWSIKQDEILIDFVKNHELMYNVHSKDFRKSQLKNSLWHEIGEILGKKDIDCSKRWAYVRDYYVRRRAKAGTGWSSEAAKKRAKLLSFLDSIPPSKRSIIPNFVDTNTIVRYTYAQTAICDRADQNFKAENENDRQPEKCYLLNENSRLQSCGEISGNIYKSEAAPEEPHNSSSNSMNLDERIKLLVEKAENQQGQDENDLFFASMAKIVKKLPARDQAEIRMEIGNLVGKAEIAHLSRSRPDSRPQSQLSFMSPSNIKNENNFSDIEFSPSSPTEF